MALAHDELLRFAAFAGACAPVIPLSLGLAGFGRPSRALVTTAFVTGVLAGMTGFITYFVIGGLKLVLQGWPQVIALGFIGAGIPEEVVKYVFLVGVVCMHEDCEIGLDIIVGAAWVGLGFAALENVMYLLQALQQAQNVYTTGLVRALMAVPFHVSLGIIMGCCVAIARQQQSSKRAWTIVALVVPILLHGTFDSALFTRTLSGGLLTLPAAFVYAGVIVVSGAAIAFWAVGVIARIGPLRLQHGARPIAASAPTRRVLRIGRVLAIVVLGLFALLFAIAAPSLWSSNRLGAVGVGGIACLMLGFTLFFWRGPNRFKRNARVIYGE